MNIIEFKNDKLTFSISKNEHNNVYISNFSTQDNNQAENYFPLIQLHASGYNQNDHHARKHTGSEPGSSFVYDSHQVYDNAQGKKFEITLQGEQLVAIWHLQYFSDLSSVRVWVDIHNHSSEDIGIEYISVFSFLGMNGYDNHQWEQSSQLHIPHNNWYGEAQWISATLPELGYTKVNKFSLDRLSYENTGTWSSIGHLPSAAFENTRDNITYHWQIEHNGSWQWEIGDFKDQLYVLISGPTENESHWWKQLSSGETFTTIPVAISVVEGGLQDALQEVNRYRRRIIKPCLDIQTLPVIFNDYMNCLFGDPTTEKLKPLIDAAAEAGCEYFCIDCGWYSDGPWWNGVGEWKPSQARFPNGIQEPIQYIVEKGMIPGLWLELEVIGIECALATMLPDECFFLKHGKRVIDHQRYQLDFRHPLVREHATQVIKRLVEEYGVAYIKMDYNINAGIGTEYMADSVGDGLLQHNRAYLAWLKSTMEYYPQLVIENCGSGGLRMDYAMLQHHSIQSITDQTDYKLMASIAASAASAVTPEQSAIWSYPLREGDREEVVMNMINAMLLRIHQSGHLSELSPERFDLVKEGIALYKTYREQIPNMTPHWPLGMPSFQSPWIAFYLKQDGEVYLAVWRMDSEEESLCVPVDFAANTPAKLDCIYPSYDNEHHRWHEQSATANIIIKEKYSARLFKISAQ
ncbi:glycoside hydrolase family 36 protein [Vibrio furnissii]|uniref:glycoside hydrolase family 36 protein n=1 Tax=Vibrio furnissii TaxID=29494 RepID=UPI002573960D|nr:glycoside hydrolase family 36 protein [Vibrio furnissii]WJG23227.1 alpha-galactosidase [Vibrio furnissii]